MSNESWRTEMKLAMKVERIDVYRDHGCHLDGKLVVVRCPEEIHRLHPRSGIFGAMSCFDIGDVAKELIVESGYDVVELLLGIQDVVVRVK